MVHALLSDPSGKTCPKPRTRVTRRRLGFGHVAAWRPICPLSGWLLAVLPDGRRSDSGVGMQGLAKAAWVAVIAVTFIGGAVAWLIVRQPSRNSSARLPPSPEWDPATPPMISGMPIDGRSPTTRWPATRPAEARSRTGTARSPRTRRRPEFLRALDNLIRGISETDEEPGRFTIRNRLSLTVHGRRPTEPDLFTSGR